MCAFSLMVTLVWLYIEILRSSLLQRLRVVSDRACRPAER